MLVLFENGTADAVLNATSFSGFGVNTSTMRYQVPNSWSHNFYAGSTSLMQLSNSYLSVLGNITTSGSLTCTALSALGNMTTPTLFVSGAETVLSTLNVSGDFTSSNMTGTSLSILGNITASGPTHVMNASSTSDISLTVRNFASGTSSLYLNSNNTLSSRLYQAADTTLFMQAYTNTSTIKFYNGTNYSFYITTAGGANASDASLKTNVSNITNAISTISQLQGVNYTLIDDPDNKPQIGFIADSVQNIVPQVVVPTEDANGNPLKFMIYCKLTALLTEGIKEQQTTINNNISSISYLNTTINNNISSISYLNTVINNNVSSITSLTTRVSILEGK